MSLSPGQAAPWFILPTPSNPRFNFSSLGGRYVLLCFLPPPGPQQAAALARLAAHEALFDQQKLIAFCVASDPASIAAARETLGVRWFLDHDGAVTRRYCAAGADGAPGAAWHLIDPSLRILAAAPLSAPDKLLAMLAALPSPDDHAGAPLHAPVLVVPRIFEPEICRRLIDLYDADGGAPSGTMRQIGDKTVAVLDGFKSRRDADVSDPDFRAALRSRIETRLISQIQRAFQFHATRIERYIVACYDAKDGGYFRAHRDNTTLGTAHRKFACSINLNAEEFDGGDLRFPEFGSRTYRPPTGGAVVFSCSLLHEATPVTKGRRYAFLPFFFDEAGEEVRRRNLHSLAPPEPNTSAQAV